MTSSKSRPSANKKTIHRRRSRRRALKSIEGFQQDSTAAVLQRARQDARLVTGANLIQLQQALGNRAVGRLVSALAENKNGLPVSSGIENAIQRARPNGKALPVGIQRQMESALGHDFNQVRTHADRRADDLNQTLNAQAFTTGPDIFFKQGHYRPDRPEGKRLLAHELTHVVQQQAAGPIKTGAVQRSPLAGNELTATPNRPLIQRGILSAIGGFFKKGFKLVKHAFKMVKNRLSQICGGKIGSKESKNILEEVFDGRNFDVSRVKIVDAKGIQEAWDKIYGKGSYDGSNGQEPDGPLEGFTAPDNTIYINKEDQAVDTVPHEVLHRHENGAVINQMGENFNEGFTEYLTQKAVTKMGYKPTSSYPEDLAVVKKMVPLIGGDTVLEDAYFDGDLATLKKKLDKAKGVGTYAKIVVEMKAGNYAKANKLLD